MCKHTRGVSGVPVSACRMQGLLPGQALTEPKQLQITLLDNRIAKSLCDDFLRTIWVGILPHIPDQTKGTRLRDNRQGCLYWGVSLFARPWGLEDGHDPSLVASTNPNPPKYPKKSIHGVSIRNRSSGLGYMLHIWVLGPLGEGATLLGRGMLSTDWP